MSFRHQNETVVIISPFLILLIICSAFVFAASAQTSTLSAVNVRLVTDEAEAVLAILAKRKTNEPVTEADWQRVFQVMRKRNISFD